MLNRGGNTTYNICFRRRIRFHDSVLTEATESDHFLLSFRRFYVTRNSCFRQRNHVITLSENYGKPFKNAQNKALHVFFRWLMILMEACSRVVKVKKILFIAFSIDSK